MKLTDTTVWVKKSYTRLQITKLTSLITAFAGWFTHNTLPASPPNHLHKWCLPYVEGV
jgi:hypothetical protein